MKIWMTVIQQKKKSLIVFNHMIAHMEANEKLSPIVVELLLRGRKISISLDFTLFFYFKVPKTIRLKVAPSYHENTLCLIWKSNL